MATIREKNLAARLWKKDNTDENRSRYFEIVALPIIDKAVSRIAERSGVEEDALRYAAICKVWRWMSCVDVRSISSPAFIVGRYAWDACCTTVAELRRKARKEQDTVNKLKIANVPSSEEDCVFLIPSTADERRKLLLEVLGLLSAQERRLIALRFGLDDEPMSFSDIGAVTHRSTQTVRMQVEAALEKARLLLRMRHIAVIATGKNIPIEAGAIKESWSSDVFAYACKVVKESTPRRKIHNKAMLIARVAEVLGY